MMGDAKKPILCLDFDGVLHSYTSGWKGAREIPDLPVPGAIKFLLAARTQFDVAILSSRSHHWFGRMAMREWLREWVFEYLWDLYAVSNELPNPVIEANARDWFEHGAIDEELREAARRIVATLKFPLHKPPAHITLDDRAITFTGNWPDLNSLAMFEPWYKN